MVARARRQADPGAAAPPAVEATAPIVTEVLPADVATVPVVEGRARPGARFVAYLGGMVLLVGLFERTDLLGVGGEVAVGLLTLAAAVAGLGFVFRMSAAPGTPVYLPTRFLIPVSAVAVAAGISYLAPDWRLHLGSQALMGAVIFNTGYVTMERIRGRERPGQEFLHDASAIVVLLGSYLAILSGVSNLAARIVLVAVITFLMAYESFNRATGGDQRAPLYSLMVAQVVTATAFGFLEASVIDAGRLSGVLLVAWYINRGIGFHILKGTMTRSIIMEYAVGGGAVLLALAATTLLNR